jgi:hypothetical protein
MRRVEEVELAAARVLEEAVDAGIWNGRSLPVPVHDIADSHFGLLIRDVDDLAAAPGAPAVADGQILSGLLLPDLGEIWVSRAEGDRWPGRRRFTIGHEVGHWVLHRRTGAGLYCRSGSVAEAEKLHVPPAEEEANVFAAALLMPADLVRRAYARRRGDFAALCAMFGASGAAMGRRLHRVIPRGR